MKALTLSIALALIVASPALAHERQAQRTIVVQVEDKQALLLVTWTAPTGILGQLMLARATVVNPKDPRAGLEMLMARRAMSGLEIRFAGKPIKPSSLRQKLTFDTSSRRRIAITVLATVDLRGSGALTVRPNAHEPTKLTWSDKTLKRVAKSSVKPGQWRRSPLEVVVLKAATAR